ncbi:hypothetical protein NLI96_g7986 [Meripilus lineatus]|uniref:F-box domain-containing protein n=1 Tax=Meripilus lineatus TaxID=2056292 RepID=A0AAD5YED8_9APHY|nr:hypothetical protein NLI96_g7986 [Physisporinus lineatus]
MSIYLLHTIGYSDYLDILESPKSWGGRFGLSGVSAGRFGLSGVSAGRFGLSGVSAGRFGQVWALQRRHREVQRVSDLDEGVSDLPESLPSTLDTSELRPEASDNPRESGTLRIPEGAVRSSQNLKGQLWTGIFFQMWRIDQEILPQAQVPLVQLSIFLDWISHIGWKRHITRRVFFEAGHGESTSIRIESVTRGSDRTLSYLEHSAKDEDSIQTMPSSFSSRRLRPINIPWDIQRHIIESVPSFEANGNNITLAFNDHTHSQVDQKAPISTVEEQFRACHTLRSCSLVCRQWAVVSQRLMFLWICLSDYEQMDKLYTLLRDPRSAHLSQNARRLSVMYRHPYKKIGEVIPRIIGMRLSRLECLDLCAGNGAFSLDYPTFQFHSSLRARLSQLNQIRILHLHNFRFSHLTEFRRFVCGFSGIRHLIAMYIKFNKDKLGDCRTIHRSREWKVPLKVSWRWGDFKLFPGPLQNGNVEVDAPSSLWIANIPNSHHAIEASSLKTTCPTLTVDVANAIMHIVHRNPRSRYNDCLITWDWRCEEGGMGDLGKDWTLNSASSDETHNRYFRFRVGSDDPQNVPLGFEHLIELCMPRMIGNTQKLHASLLQEFQELQELFGGFPNVEKINLALKTTDWIFSRRQWGSESGYSGRNFQKEYAVIVTIIEEFRLVLLQTGFDMDFTIDGSPPEELRPLISSMKIDELLWPIHIPIPWSIQRHIIESIPSFVPANGDNSVLAFDDLTHSRAVESKPITTIRNQIGACQTLRSCSLVCRRWATVCRKLIFLWICLSNHAQTNKLHTLLHDPQSSHLSQNVRRLSIVYRHPYEKIGEVIPRIAGMDLTHLECLDLISPVCMRLLRDSPSHFHFVKLGKNELENVEPTSYGKGWQMPTKVSWLSPRSLLLCGAHREALTPSILWLANIPDSHRAIEALSLKTTCPGLTVDVANAITHTTHYYTIEETSYPLITWRWQCEEGSTSGPRRDWTLICVSSHKHHDHYFRFRVGFDSPLEIPLGLEHLIEPCIPYLIGMKKPQDILVSLLQKFRKSQELFGGFPNVEKIKLALLTDGEPYPSQTPWISQSEKTKRKPITYAPIVEEFRRSQTDFDLDITIDGVPLEELLIPFHETHDNDYLDDLSLFHDPFDDLEGWSMAATLGSST